MAFWDKIGSHGRVEDRRGFAPVVGGISITGIALLFLINALAGGDPAEILRQLPNIPLENRETLSSGEFEGEDEYEIFASSVLGSSNTLWRDKFDELDLNYDEPLLVLFRDSTKSGCGIADSRVGPHYCPLDATIYLDETFFDELTARFGAKGGDVAEAYVIAHEVGHHVQNELGILNNPSFSENANEASIAQELQADCFAGMWANSIKDIGVLEPGEIAEAMDAAEAVGDDRIQETVSGRVNPENWTHGSSSERVHWFNKGYEAGSLNACGID